MLSGYIQEFRQVKLVTKTHKKKRAKSLTSFKSNLNNRQGFLAELCRVLKKLSQSQISYSHSMETVDGDSFHTNPSQGFQNILPPEVNS